MISKAFSWTSDNRAKVEKKIHEAIADAMESFGEAMLSDANTRVPLEEGTLERSGEVSIDRSELTVAITYDTPYAQRQHEDTTLKHDAGREAKWLENTLKNRGREMAPYVAEKVRRVT